MPTFSLKKPAPVGWVIFCGWALITLGIFQEIHSLRPPVITPLYLVLINFIPGALLTALVFWGIGCASRKGFLQILLALTLLFYWVDLAVSYFHMVGKTTPELEASVRSWSFGHFFVWVVLIGFNNQLLSFLTGWSFYKKKPWFFSYEQVDPFQNVLLKFVGVLWMLLTLWDAFKHIFALQAFRAHFL